MAFRVVFQPRARLDIDTAIAWFNRASSRSAAQWRAGLFRIVENLETDPNRYPAADEAAVLGVDLRQLLFGRRRKMYRVLFTIEGQTVNILRVRHADQDHLGPDDI